jgi:hypothetical protein
LLREYFIGIIGLCVFFSLVVGASHPRAALSVRFGAGILAICAFLLPLVDIIANLDIDKTLDGIFDDVDYNATDSAIELAFEDGIAQYLAHEHGVERECISVRVDGFDISSLCAERIYVTLSGRAALLDYKSIEAELVERFTHSGECEVSIGLG